MSNRSIMFQDKQLKTPIDSLQFSILASGSSGNCTYIESNSTRLLVDAGLSGKKIEGLFNKIDRQISDIDAILITHEHSDHIHGLGVLARRYHIPIYANRKTWQAMDPMIGKVDHSLRYEFELNTMMTIGDIDIISYPVSHDAVQPQFYAFQKSNKQFVMLTDTGYVSDRLRDQLRNASAYLIESNHELEMLRSGRYPWPLKQRILGDKGHLSNVDGALVMTDMIGDLTKSIYLGHLSRDNNTKEIAMNAMESILTRYQFDTKNNIQLVMTDPIIPTVLRRL